MTTNLKQDILHLLTTNKQGLSAREIAHILKSDKSDVNRVLYEWNEEGAHVTSNAEFKWTLRGKGKPFWKTSDLSKEKFNLTAEVYFNPETNCRDIICKHIALAKSTLHIQIYLLWCQRILGEIEKSALSGVKIFVIVDDKPRNKASIDRLRAIQNVTVLKDELADTNHNKVIVIDGSIIIHGSINFNDFYGQNRETVTVLHGEKLAMKFIENWNKNAESITINAEKS